MKLSDLESIVGIGNTTDAETTCTSYVLARSPNEHFFIGKKPDFVVYPQTSEQVAGVMRLATKTGTPVLARGSGSSTMSGNLSLKGGILIDLRHMDSILNIDEDNMVVVAEGGCSAYKILRECHNKGLMLPIGPEWQAGPQIGANVATNATGHYINRTGRLGDLVVGLEVVLATGDIVTLGSAAYKWGTYYHRYMGTPDPIGLFINSGGTMGIITKVALRLLNWPKTSYLAYGWTSDKINEVTKAHYELQRYAEILSIELFNRATSMKLESIDIKPPIKIPKGIEFIMLLVQAGQTEEELIARTRQVHEICERNGGENLGDIWQRIAGPPDYWWFDMYCHTSYASARINETVFNPACTMFHCPTMKFPEIYQLGRAIYVEKYGFPENNYRWYGWAERNSMAPYPTFFYKGKDKQELEHFKQFWREYHLELAKIGCVSYNVGIGHPKEMREWLGPAYKMILKIKKTLDPSGILGPGAL